MGMKVVPRRKLTSGSVRKPTGNPGTKARENRKYGSTMPHDFDPQRPMGMIMPKKRFY